MTSELSPVSPAATGGRVWAERAWLGDERGVASHVLISHDSSGLITDVQIGRELTSCPGAVRLGGDVCIPGFVNAHSHAFHRALRGVSETASGSFWTWRDLMYRVAGVLDPDSYRELATLVYAEMLLAGYSTVGEFHYLHHGPNGHPYDDRNEMGYSITSAARAAGIRLTLLDACYLQAGVDGTALSGVQLRFGDGSGEAWSERVSSLLESKSATGPSDLARFGVAAHSVRATPPQAIRTVAALAASEDLPLHVHLSEQRQENEDCLKVLGFTPTDLLHDCGALTSRTTAVHATHLTTRDLGRLGLASCGVCACPTTERDLGDGISPYLELSDAGAVLSVGSDSHAVIDPFEETRAIELDERLSSERRGMWTVAALLAAGTSGGSRALGWPAGGLQVGSAADIVGISFDSLRLAGRATPSAPREAAAAPLSGGEGAAGTARRAGDEELLARILFAATPAEVDTVVVAGRVLVEGGEHVNLGPTRALAERLSHSIRAALDASS
ncbi:MAG: formimidoylglutamate deiminase [Acidimicrobiales bacterium]